MHRAIIATPLLLLNALPAAHACGLDGVPSISANGVLARLTPGVPVAAQLSHWAPFTFSDAVAPGKPVRLAEDRRLLLRSLPPEAVNHPYRWTFGDGKATIGYVVRHAYARAGTYKIGVSTYVGPAHKWFLFDTVLIRVSLHMGRGL